MNNTHLSRIREITVLCALTDFDTKKINSQLIWTVTNTGSYSEFRETLSECLGTACSSEETVRMISDAETQAAKILDDIESRNAASDELHKITLLTELDPEYPAMLNDLADDRPVLLFMMGSPALLSADTAAIIGSRWPTEAGITAGNALADTLITLIRDFDFSSPDEPTIPADRTKQTDVSADYSYKNPGQDQSPISIQDSAVLHDHSSRISAATPEISGPTHTPVVVSGLANSANQSETCPAAFIQTPGQTQTKITVSGPAKENDRSASDSATPSQSPVSTQFPVIVSGLANGCDTIGHRAALKNGVPTVAVLPGGFDHIVPANNKELAEEILASRGALLTEYLPETLVEKNSYLRRDRLVAALSKAVAVIQCDLKSGTMYTVNCASRLARPVCALSVPAGADPGTFTGNTHIIENNIGDPITDPASDIPAFLQTVEKYSRITRETSDQLRFI